MSAARFKDKGLQGFYENCRRLGTDTATEFYFTDRDGTRQPRRGAGHRCAYWNGREGKPSSWPRNTFAHAAWAAGQDDAKQQPIANRATGAPQGE